MLVVKRTQYAIGQGGFHAAEITVGDTKFRYIYDCGSKPVKAVEGIIKNQLANDYGTEFDWLIISSFDEDHVNGAVKLLGTFKFKAIILPHLLNEDLFKHILLLYVVKGNQENLFVIFEFFSRVIGGEFGVVIPGSASEFNKESDIDFSGTLTSELLKNSPTQVSGDPIKFKNINWMLRFYSVEIHYKNEIDNIFNKSEYSELLKAINKLKNLINKKPDKSLKNEKIETIFKKIIDELTNNINGEKLKEDLEKELKGINIDIHDYNSASLCLYSGPIPGQERNYKDLNLTRKCESNRHDKVLDRRDYKYVGWLGVGDFSFTTKSSIENFIQHYAREIPLAGTRMVPHHGSQLSYDKNLNFFRQFADANPNEHTWVAAADPINGRYKHPHGVIVAECLLTGYFHLVSADPATTLIEYIYEF